MTARLVVVSGPSGVGKSSLVDAAVARNWRFVTPYTTRVPRPSEVPGRDYHFLTVAQFHQGIRDRRFSGWDFTLGQYYGSGQELGQEALGNAPVILHALARLALRLRDSFEQAHLVFLDCADDTILERRLHDRGVGGAELTVRRLHWAEERTHAPLFDEALNGDELDVAGRSHLLERLEAGL